jgi:polygalacturonase
MREDLASPLERRTPFEMPALEVPSFAPRVFALPDYGGRAYSAGAEGDGVENTAAFARAIEACHEAGGGTVLVPAGTWLTGPIHLHSNVNLRLDAGAVVRFSTCPADYPPVFTRWEGVECVNYSPFIYARDCENVAVSGEGILEGQGQAWWHWKNLQGPAAKRLYDAQAEGVPPEHRVFATEAAALRPQFLQTLGCRNVLVEGVTFVNGPMWTVHPVYCENVVVRGITVRSEGPNTDGLNPDSCRCVLVEGCHFHTGDDCIAINAGMNEDGWRVGRPCEKIVIRDCRMSEGHGAVSIGSGMSGGVRDVWVHDSVVTGGDHAIRLKSMRGRGGYIENVYVEGLQVFGLRREAILLNMFYGASTAPSRSDAAPAFRDVVIRDVDCHGAGAGVVIRGLAEQPIERVLLERLRLEAVEGIRCQEAIDITFGDVSGVVEREPLFACSNVRGLNVRDMSLTRRGRER